MGGIYYGSGAPRGASRVVDWVLDITPNEAWPAAGFHPRMRVGQSLNTPVLFPKPANGAGPNIRWGMWAYTILNGASDAPATPVLSPFSSTKKTGTFTPTEDAWVSGHRLILGVNAAALAQADDYSLGVDFQSDDANTSTSIWPIRNAPTLDEGRGIGLHARGGKWVLEMRKTGNVAGAQPVDYALPLNIDGTLPHCFDCYFVNSARGAASRFELWIDNVFVTSMSYDDANNKLPDWNNNDGVTPERAVPGPIVYLRGGKTSADGRELALLGYQFIQGPDVAGTRFQ